MMKPRKTARIAWILIVIAGFAHAAIARQDWQVTMQARQAQPPVCRLPERSALASPSITCGPYCNKFAGGSTDSMTGTGASCADAEANLTATLKAIAKADCQGQTGKTYCNFTTGFRPCSMTGPDTYEVQGIANYNCEDTNC